VTQEILTMSVTVAAVPGWLQIIRESGQAFQAWVTPCILVAGGIWAFYRFRRGRTYRQRLEITVEGNVERSTGLRTSEELLYLTVTVKVRNIGDGAVKIDAGDDLLAVETLRVPEDRLPWDAEWDPLVDESLRPFAGGLTLEPDEPIEEQRLLGLPDSGFGALKITAQVGSRKARKKWDHAAVVPIDRRVDNEGVVPVKGTVEVPDEHQEGGDK
jgi:hypothetical protein